MPRTIKFNELRAEMLPEAQAEARRLADKDLDQMALPRTLDTMKAADPRLEEKPA